MNYKSTSTMVEQPGTIMKQVDALVKSKNYEEALEKVRAVLEMDVKNTYARAYEERILSLIMEHQKEKLHVETERKLEERVESEVKRRLREFQKQQEIESLKRKQFEKKETELETNARKASTEERQAIVQKGFAEVETETANRIKAMEQKLVSQMEKSFTEEQKRLEEESKRRIAELTISLQRVAGLSDGASVSRDEELLRFKIEYENKLHKAKEHFEKKMLTALDSERQKIEKDAFDGLRAEHNATIEKITAQMEDERKQVIEREHQKAKDRMLEAYRALVISMKTLKLDEGIYSSLLQSVRIPLNILPDDHAAVMRSVQLNAYIEALKETWAKGKPSDEETGTLKNLQTLYQISDREHEQLLQNIKKELGIPDESAVILVIDDDDMILQFVSHILKQTYSNVLLAQSVEEGITIMEKHQPAVILCDVHLKSPGIGGFSFYQKITSGAYGESIKQAPFVLMSSITDEFFIDSAKQLGITDYVPKPFTREILQSTIQTALAKVSQ